MHQQLDHPSRVHPLATPGCRFPAGVWLIAGISLLVHGLANLGGFGYGYFRDELYYLACADHLAAGYVDHPPLSVWLLALQHWVLGDSLFALRVLPALAGSGIVLVTAWMARDLGGGRRVQTLAALASACAPVVMAVAGFYSMNAFEVLLWSGVAALIIALQRHDRPRLWIGVGVLLGLAVLNKHTAITFALALLFAVLATPARRHLATRWPWIGVMLAVLIVLPNLIWQIMHGFPSLEFYANAQALKNVPQPPHTQLLNLTLFMNPVALPLWLAGLYWYLFDARARPYRPLGLIFCILLAALLLSHSSRVDRIAGAFPMLFAAGAVALRQISLRLMAFKRARLLAGAGTAVLIIATLFVLPTVLPILPPAPASRLARALGLAEGLEQGQRLLLPQILSDRFGWPEIVEEVTHVYERLSPEEQRRTHIFTANYGQAGAIDFLDRQDRLPPAFSGHNNYFLWGSGNATGDILITVGIPRERLGEIFADVRVVEVIDSPYGIEHGTVICIAREPNVALRDAWPGVKVYR